ncbi:hypothetical protein DER44DRAFT_788715 [Fusarium oxysporum]|nr:hypothetical protein DER44DRAFT_788715 [Fusarium oxysporum]
MGEFVSLAIPIFVLSWLRVEFVHLAPDHDKGPDSCKRASQTRQGTVCTTYPGSTVVQKEPRVRETSCVPRCSSVDLQCNYAKGALYRQRSSPRPSPFFFFPIDK